LSFLLAHKRRIVGGFIVAVLSIAAWTVGPLLGPEGEQPLAPWSVRLLLVLLFIALWLSAEALIAFLAHRQNRRLMEGMAAESAEDKLSREESAVLRSRFNEAMATLARTQLGGRGGSRHLYQLPWYVIIGEPGSGKTTALLNSGLRFPLSAGSSSASALGGVGGTRNCDWFFTEEAVLIDTAGRYIAQDSNAPVDHSAWLTFLGLLKKYRPRQPINGVIATLSIQDLLRGQPTDRQLYANRIRTRLEELQQALGLQCPVYLMITKSDLIPGFNQFFSNLDAEQRAQVWGDTFAFDLAKRQAAPPSPSFDAAFPALVERVNGLLLQRLLQERDAEARAEMYAFPQQFAAIGPLIREFIDIAFSDTRFAQPVMLRGVYFTSGTQLGSPIDRLIFGLSSALDLRGAEPRIESFASAGKSYFISRLLRDVIFGEAGLAAHSEEREKQLRNVSYGVMVTTALMCAGLVGAWTVSYFANRYGLQSAAEATAVAARQLASVGPPGQSDLPLVLEALDALRTVPAALHNPVDDPPWSMRWGLYQGEPVAASVGERYRLALQQGLMPRVALHLEATMANPRAAPEEVYAALKTYLMMYDDRRMNDRWFLDAVSELWRARFGAAVSERAKDHLAALVDTKDLQVVRFHPPDNELVATARGRVAALPLVDRAFAMIRLTTARTEPLRLSEILGPAGVGVLDRRSQKPLNEVIEAIFTAEGYRKGVKPNIREAAQQMVDEEAWVLGDKASGVGRRDSVQVTLELQRRYFDEYERAWRGLLDDVQLRKVEGLRDAQVAARALGQPDSPLRRLVVTVAEQTRLASGGGTGDKVRNAAEETVGKKLKDAAQGKVTGLFGSQAADIADRVQPSDPTRQLELRLEESFKDIRDLAGDGKSGRIDAALALINEVAGELLAMQQRIGSGLNINEVPPRLGNARAQSSTFPPPVSSLIAGLVKVGEDVGKTEEMQSFARSASAASSYCRRATPGKYPFNRNSNQDVGVQDFETVFKAGGELDSFFTKELGPHIDKSGPQWRLRSAAEGSPKVSLGTLRQFQNADAIRNAFLAGGNAARVVVDLTVASALGEVVFDYGGVRHSLKAGSSVRLNWPAPPGARMSIGGAGVVAVEGPWALFRFVDKGTLDPSSSGDRLRMGYTAVDGAKVTIELRTGSSAFNPFRLRELNDFACP
jgi:type VI secretion system protein ImpL